MNINNINIGLPIICKH